MDDGSFDKKDVNLDEASIETPDMEESLETPEVGTTIEAEDTGSAEIAADTNVGDLPVNDIDPAVDTPSDTPVVKNNPFLDDAPATEDKIDAGVNDEAVEAVEDRPVEEATPVSADETPADDVVEEAPAVAEETPVEDAATGEEEPVAESAPEADSEPVTEPTASPVEEAAPAVAAAVATDVSPAPAEPANEKKKGGNKALVIVLVIVLLAAAGLCGWYFFSNMGTSGNNNEANETAEEKEEIGYEIKGNGLNDFDLSFLKIENKGSNKIYSPLSIKTALGMLSEGTDGDTKDQIDKIIGSYEAKKYINSENLSLANGLFVRNDFKDKVKSSYTKALSEKYNADIVYDSFEKADTLNSWVSSKTLRQINKVMDDGDINDFRFLLVNALAIDMYWADQLQCSYNGNVDCRPYSVDYLHEKYSDDVSETGIDGVYEKMTFNGQKDVDAARIGASINNYDIISKIGEDKIKKTVKAEYEKWLKTSDAVPYVDENNKTYTVDEYVNLYMTQLKSNYKKVSASTTISILNDDDVKAYAKDLKEYGGTTLQYIAIMPKETELKDFIKNTSAEDLNEKISGLKEINNKNFKDGVITRIYGFIPFFKYDDNLELIEDLKEMGITDVFDSEKADMSKFTTAKDAYISDALHMATIEFSNDGVKAAAATIAGGRGAAGYDFDYEWDVPVEEIDMTFDKPFMYLIRDKKTGEVWFTGAVYQAGEN